MALRAFLLICSAFLLLFAGPADGQTSGDYLITAHTSGAIQFRDPATLDIVSSIHVELSPRGTGIDGVLADPMGRTLYMEGPEQEHLDPNGQSGCCWLYSIELQNLQVKVAAGIWGTRSRRRFVDAGPSLLTAVSDEALAATSIEEEHWQISPNRRWWAGVRSGPSIDLYDATEGKVTKSFTVENVNPDLHLIGAWIKDQFYIYATHDGSGWLWRLSPDRDHLEEPAAVPDPSIIHGCQDADLTEMSAAGDRLVLHESFGGALDRRPQCPVVTGGAWIIDVASHSVTAITPQLYFWRLIPSRDGTSLYGVTSGNVELGTPPRLVHLDAHSGKILQTRSLESGYWWIAAPSLRSIPSGDQLLVLPVEPIP